MLQLVIPETRHTERAPIHANITNAFFFLRTHLFSSKLPQMNDSHVAFSSYVIYHLKALLHLASLFFFNEDLLLSGLTSSLYVYTRFSFALGFKIFLMWACLKPHTLTSPQCYILLGNSCFERGFNDRVQSGFSPSNSASNFRKRSLFFVWMCWSRVATGQPLCQHFCARWEKIGTRLHFFS